MSGAGERTERLPPVGHRMNAWLVSLAAEIKTHAETLRKFPPKNVGL